MLEYLDVLTMGAITATGDIELGVDPGVASRRPRI